LNLGADTT